MTIKEVENELGITRANVRFYEKEGLIFPKRNPLNDYRDYSKEDVETLRRILFLRSLDVPLESIRLLEQGMLKLGDVVKEQMSNLEQQQRKIEEAHLYCENLLAEEPNGFLDFQIPEAVTLQQNKNLKDTLTDLWMFWDKLVVWGFFALQIIYTIVVLPLLPDQIPASWQGAVATDYVGKWFFPFWLLLSIAFTYCVRIIIYRDLKGWLRCYLDEVNAVVTVGAIGFGFSMQVYTVFYLQGLKLDVDAFLLACVGIYLCVVFLIVLIYRKYKRKRDQ